MAPPPRGSPVEVASLFIDDQDTCVVLSFNGLAVLGS